MSALLTTEVCEKAWEQVAPWIESHMRAEYGDERTNISFKVMDEDTEEVVFAPFIGKEEQKKYDDISLSKVKITVRECSPTADVSIQERLPGETRFYGSAYFPGFGVSASGVMPFHDEMYSYVFGAAIQAAMKKIWEETPDDQLWLPKA